MKHKIRDISRKALSLLLALTLCISSVVGLGATPALAAGERTTVYMITFPRGGDAVTSGWGHPALTYKGGWSIKKSTSNMLRVVGSYTGNIAYCIEPGVSQHTGDSFTSRDENYWDNFPSNGVISSDDIKVLVGRIMQYGYQGGVSQEWRTQTGTGSLSYALATQFLIWEVIVGERDADFNKVGAGGASAILDQLLPTHPLYSEILSYYGTIEANVRRHTMLPSFFARSTGRAQEVELTWDGAHYTATLTDTNNVLSNYSFSANTGGFHFSTSGNQLTITADSAPADSVMVTANKNSSTRMGMITWTDGTIAPGSGTQDLVSYTQGVADPVQGFLKLRVSYGSAKIVKTSEDGHVDGISFTVSGNGIERTAVTGPDGIAQADNLMPGTYTVTELTPEPYKPQESCQVTVQAGQVAEVSFSNVLKRGSLKVTKTSEDDLVGGVKFHLTGTSLSGQAVDEYAVTDENGVAKFKDLPIGSGYTLEEVDTAVRYVIPDNQTTAIQWDTVTDASVENRLKKWQITLTKTDSETGTPQGDATLAGAVYGVYRGEDMIDSYTTDANGQFTTRTYPCGEDWSLREITPSEGYLLDESIHPVGAAPGLFTLEINPLTADVMEQVIKGAVSILKHTDDGNTGLETPESGAAFQLYRKAAGSFDAAAETERDTLTCDENGYAQSKALPYGVYVVHQTSGWEGRDLMPDFEVYIAKDAKIYRFLANNATFESRVRIVKQDAETGKDIPCAGVGFQLFDPDGEQITYRYTYPTPGEIDTFYTNSEGWLITPEALKYGKGYSLVEVQAPHGYVLDREPVYFDITAENAGDGTGDEDGVTVVQVVKKDTAQKGIVRIEKRGEVFSTVQAEDGLYTPVFTEQGLQGAVYEITAAEDIVTADGTQRAACGDVVDTIITDATGLAQSKPLYLGRYELREITAPTGMVLDTETHAIELAYAGQEVEITENTSQFMNTRQKAAVTLKKTLEQDETFGIGQGSEMSAVVFGVYAAEAVTAADGTVIPQDGLIERVTVDADGQGRVATELPFGSYYLREIAADAHYLVSDTRYPFEVTYTGPDTALVELNVNNGQPIRNDLLRGSVQGKKKDESGSALAGAVFGLFRADATEFMVETALMLANSGEDGTFTFTDVPFGSWVVRELAAPVGFLLDDASYPVEMDEDGKVIEIEAVNRKVLGAVQLTKVDRDYPENKLSGAVFEIWIDTNGDQALGSGDVLLGEMPEVTTGVYEQRDLAYGDYLLRETKAPDGFYLDTGIYPFAIRENGKTVVVENNAGKGFLNAPQVGNLKIVKTSSDGRVQGFSFRVTGPNGYDRTFTTDARGEITIEGLRLGDYTVSEVRDGASASYVLPADQTVTVKDRLTVQVSMHNIFRDTPKTGDTRSPSLWGSLLALALASALFCCVMAYRARKRK